MSNDLNSCAFIGRLGSDPATKFTQANEQVASFSIAVGSTWKDKASGEKRESVEWVNITAFGKLAQICSEYLSKGSQIYVSGRIKTDKVTTKDGVEKYYTKIIADRMQMLSSAKTHNATEAESPKVAISDSTGFDDFDIPF